MLYQLVIDEEDVIDFNNRREALRAYEKASEKAAVVQLFRYHSEDIGEGELIFAHRN